LFGYIQLWVIAPTFVIEFPESGVIIQMICKAVKLIHVREPFTVFFFYSFRTYAVHGGWECGGVGKHPPEAYSTTKILNF
jgi:hypothetical protein